MIGRPRLSLDLLRTFRCAARHLSFTRAARELFITQSAVSRAVRTLESQLGRALFFRVNRALALTEAGEALYRATDRALTIIESTTERLAGSTQAVSVTTTTALASTWLVPKLAAFTRAHPGTDIRVFGTNDAIDLEREGIDVALRFVLRDAEPSGAERLVAYRIFPVCLPSMARSRKRPLRTPADLGRHVRLEYEAVLYCRPWYDWEHWFDAMRMTPTETDATLRFSHYDQVIGAALGGTGVAIGKWPHLAGLLRDGALLAPFGAAAVAHIGDFHLVVAQHAQRRDDVRRFVGWLRDAVAEDEAASPAYVRTGASGHAWAARPSRPVRTRAVTRT